MLPSERRKLAKKQQARELLKKKMAAARAKAGACRLAASVLRAES